MIIVKATTIGIVMDMKTPLPNTNQDIALYADGSSTGKVGEGGWSFVIVNSDRIICEAFGGEPNTTNNRMELLGIIEGLRYLHTTYPATINLTIYSDSQYAIKGIQDWFPQWELKIARGKVIKNQDLWLDYKQLIDLFPNCKLQWIRGHAGNVFNERCDTLAKQGKLKVKENGLIR